MFMGILMCVFMMILFFSIFFFPVLDEYFFFLGSQINRFSTNESIIQLGDIVARDVLFAMGCEMSLHDSCECIQKELKWFFVLFVRSVFFSLCFLLQKCYQSRRRSRTHEGKRLIASKLDHHIRHPDQSRNPRMRPNLNSLDLIIRDIEQIRRKPLPLYIDDCRICRHPYIRIPVKYLVHDDSVYHEQVESKIHTRYSWLYIKHIIIVQKNWNQNRKKNPQNNILQYHKKMTMKNINDRIVWSKILREEKGVKSIHGNKIYEWSLCEWSTAVS